MGDQLPIEEIQRQMRQMEGKVTTLTVKGSQMEATCKKDIQRKAQENATLVQELTADINARHLQAQQEENKKLRKKMDRLLRGEEEETDSTLPAPSSSAEPVTALTAES